MLKLPAIGLIIAVCLSACSIAPEGVNIHDPYEERNRSVHAFNKSVSASLPSGGGDEKSAIPPELTQRVISFSDTISLPGMVLNGVLQGDVEGVVANSFRFAVNSTVGVLGLFDPATAIGMKEHETDFGQTLEVWGFAEGAYLEVPFLGPTTERDLAGRIVDMIIDPLEHVGHPYQIDYGTIGNLAARVVKVTDAGDTIDSVLVDNADSYAMLRLLYLQNRRYELGTTAPEEAFDPYDDIYGVE